MPGNYSVMIKATSLAKDIGNNYTPPFYFFIKVGGLGFERFSETEF